VIYPVSEVFESIQGEGAFAGTSMIFIRLAGCSVGKPYTPEERQSMLGQQLQVYQERCHTFDNRSFPCDTDYRVKFRATEEDIIAYFEKGGFTSKCVCITGGEPLIHDLEPLLLALWAKGFAVHLETSGTKSVRSLRLLQLQALQDAVLWITVSPKRGWLVNRDEAVNIDEFKFLVDGELDVEELERAICLVDQTGERIWLQPINEEHTVNQTNVQRCLELIKKYPAVRLSIQLHKILGVR
jgi:7-carboxy-7-deazaguanine synthase